MDDANHRSARALFVAPDGNLYPDYLVCSGKLIIDSGGQPCTFSVNGRLPKPQPLDPNVPGYSLDKGKPGELCPPCAKQQLANLGHWDGHRSQKFPDELKPLRLFKCSQWLWLVVMGLRQDNPSVLQD
jgi:hypothetical protein